MKTGLVFLLHRGMGKGLLAEEHLNRKLFGAMLDRIWALPVAGR
jgi:hypothetical protein